MPSWATENFSRHPMAGVLDCNRKRSINIWYTLTIQWRPKIRACHMYLESPHQGLFKSIWHIPLLCRLKIFDHHKKGQLKRFDHNPTKPHYLLPNFFGHLKLGDSFFSIDTKWNNQKFWSPQGLMTNFFQLLYLVVIKKHFGHHKVRQHNFFNYHRIWWWPKRVQFQSPINLP
jgi:hypothetical protein